VPSAPLRVAVLGAGYVGSAAARALAARGDAVWAVRRRAHPPEPGITWCAGDVTSGAIAGLPDALDAVVLAVAPSGPGDEYDRIYPPAARAAVALARASGARALVYTSSTGVYGERDGGWVDESTPVRGEGPGNRALIEAEQVLLTAGVSGTTVLRVAGIYGPGRDPRPRFARAEQLPVHGEYWVNLAHRDDIVRAILDSVHHTDESRILNVADGTPAYAADIARWLAAQAGRDPSALRFEGSSPLARSNQRIATAALLATGWRAAYPSFREGFLYGLMAAE
jgi:nucleoside-diphosphate-sugar epimerase